MSILDGLVRRDWDGFPSEDGTVVVFDDVREALRNPTDEQVEQGAKALAAHMELWPEQCVDGEWAALTPAERADWITLTREAWAAAAGGER